MSKPAVSPTKWHPPTASDIVPGPISGLRTYPVPGIGPEDVLVAPDGTVITGIDDGRILRVDPTTGDVQTILETAGRPLGLEWLPDGRLLICDAEAGLLAADLTDATIEILTTVVDGRRVRICNNAAVASDGTIWFSDSSSRFDLDHWKGDLIEHSGTGRLIRRDPDGSATTIVTGLQFANGVALAPDESAVYVAQTGAYSLDRVPLSGAHEGRLERAVPVLPGFPDNISTGSDGLIWVAIASPRNAILDVLAPLPPILRKGVWALPDALQPKPVNYTGAIAFDPVTDTVVAAYATEVPAFGVSTGVRELDGTVWLGSLSASSIASFAIRS